MKLFVDQGNTAVKWRLIDDDGRVYEEREHDSRLTLLLKRLELLGRLEGSVYVASVAASSRRAEIEASLRAYSALFKFVPVAVRRSFGGLTIAYDDVSALGVDRWLIMLAAVQEFGGGVVVISAGTATTFDRVARDGMHEGGLIAPGWAALKSLVQSTTANIDSVLEDLEPRPCLGKSTKECLSQGTSLMAASFVDRACRLFALDDDAKLLSGGNAPALNALLDGSFLLRSSLVLDGLEVYARLD